MPTKIQLRRGSASQWASANPILASGEMGLETDTAKAKFGNGSGYWNDLPYVFVSQSELEALKLGDLADVSSDAPSVDDVLRWNGSEWAPGARSAVSAGSGVDFFFNTASSDITGYDLLQKTPDTSAAQDEFADCTASSGHVLIDAYIGDAIGDTKLDAGIWDLEFFSYVSIPDGISQVHFHFYKRSTSGVETMLFHMDSGHVDALTPTLFQVASTQPQFSVDPTDRLVIKVFAATDNASTVRVHFLHSGNDYWTHVTTPLIQKHADLAGLQGGASGQYYHLTASEYTGTGTGAFVRATALNSYVPLTQKAAANGVATLDANSKLTFSQAPTGSATSVSTSSANAEGSAVNLARADHTHAVTVTHSEATATAAATTTSTTDTQITGMTLTPAAGTYLVMFSTWATHNTNNATISFSIYAGNAQVAPSVRTIIPRVSNTVITQMAVATQAIVTVNGSQAIEARWSTTSGTATANQRTLTIVKLG